MEMELPSYFPHEVVVGILSRLPVKSLLRFRCVCKSFRSLISDPHFVKIHLNQGAREREKILLSSRTNVLSMPHYSTDGLITPLEKIDYAFNNQRESIGSVCGSCNGLLLIVSINRKTLFLWNPSTRECKVSNPADQTKDFYSLYGLGNSKLVMIIQNFNHNYALVYVLSLETNIWTTWVEYHPYKSTPRTISTLLNEILHWVLRRADDYGCEIGDEIVCFDLAENKFNGKIPLPDFRFSPYDLQLRVSGGCLCVVGSSHRDGVPAVEVWVMKEYEVKESWVNLFNVVLNNDLRWLSVLPFTNNGDVLVMDLNGEKLMFCNPETNTCRVIPVPDHEMRLVPCCDGTDFEKNIGDIVVTEVNRMNLMVCNPEKKTFRMVNKMGLVPIPVKMHVMPYTYVESLVSVHGLQ